MIKLGKKFRIVKGSKNYKGLFFCEGMSIYIRCIISDKTSFRIYAEGSSCRVISRTSLSTFLSNFELEEI